MKHYLLSVYQPTDGTPPPPEVLDRIFHELDQLNGDIKAAGEWVFAGGLNSPSTATVLQRRGDEVLMTDGPFIEGKEYLGGFTILQAADLDRALKWGRRVAEITGLPIEVRPFIDDSERGPR